MIRGKRIALVLGAGGPVGHAYHAGVLAALEQVWDWDAREADVVIGTSAGAQVGALIRAGMQPSDLLARAMGEPLSVHGAAIARYYTRAPRVPHPRYPRRFVPASPEYLYRSMLQPWRLRPGRFFASLLPHGRACLRPEIEGLQRVFGDRWPDEHLWITAVELTSGATVAFGHPQHPRTDVGTAVACSGAVPSICAPVVVEAAHYIDGGVASATHLHLAEESDVDVVVVSSPLSCFAFMRWLFRRELRRLARKGIEVIALEPCPEVIREMGLNPLRVERSARVARAARASTVARLLRARSAHQE